MSTTQTNGNLAATTDWADVPLVLSVKQAARLIGVGYRPVYDLARTADFPALKLGNRIIIPRDALRAWLDNRCSAGMRRA